MGQTPSFGSVQRTREDRLYFRLKIPSCPMCGHVGFPVSWTLGKSPCRYARRWTRSRASAMNGKMPPGPSAEGGGRDGGRPGQDLGCTDQALHDEPWKAALECDHWGRIGTKSIQDTYRTPYQALHVHAPVNLCGISFVQYQCGGLIRSENKTCSVKPTFMWLGTTM